MSEEWIRFDGPYPSKELSIGGAPVNVYASPYDIPSYVKGKWLRDNVYEIELKYLDDPAGPQKPKIIGSPGTMVTLYGIAQPKGATNRVARIEIKPNASRRPLEDARRTLVQLQEGEVSPSEKMNFASVEAALKVLE